MARTTNPITLAATKVAEAQRKAELADRAVVRLRDAENRARDAHAVLDAAAAELTALIRPAAPTPDLPPAA